MIIYIASDGQARLVSPQHVYQGSNVTDITVVAPFPPQTAMTVAFSLPDSKMFGGVQGTIQTPPYMMTLLANQPELPDNVYAWQYVMPFAITQNAGQAKVSITAQFAQGSGEAASFTQQTSAQVEFTIEPSVVGTLPDEPTEDAWSQIINAIAATQGNVTANTSDIEDIVNGTTAVGKAVADQKGNVIDETYATKTALGEAADDASEALEIATKAKQAANTALTTANSALSAVNSKQDKADDALATTQKTVVGAINENKSAIDNLREKIINEAHFRGFFQSSTDLPTDGVDINDYAYVADDNSIWIYGASGWTDSGKDIPDNATKITVGSTSTGEPGTEANVVNSGTSSDAILDFTIPRGDPGEAQLVCWDVGIHEGSKSDSLIGKAITPNASYFNRTPKAGDRFLILEAIMTSLAQAALEDVRLCWAQVQSLGEENVVNAIITAQQSVMGLQGKQGEQGEQGEQGPQGIPGPKGENGDGLEIKKWYGSVEDMNADYSNADIAVGDSVAIDNTLDLYVKGAAAFEYKGTLKGEQGAPGDGVPSGGTAGQFLQKTADGTAWANTASPVVFEGTIQADVRVEGNYLYFRISGLNKEYYDVMSPSTDKGQIGGKVFLIAADNENGDNPILMQFPLEAIFIMSAIPIQKGTTTTFGWWGRKDYGGMDHAPDYSWAEVGYREELLFPDIPIPVTLADIEAKAFKQGYVEFNNIIFDKSIMPQTLAVRSALASKRKISFADIFKTANNGGHQ